MLVSPKTSPVDWLRSSPGLKYGSSQKMVLFSPTEPTWRLMLSFTRKYAMAPLFCCRFNQILRLFLALDIVTFVLVWNPSLAQKRSTARLKYGVLIRRANWGDVIVRKVIQVYVACFLLICCITPGLSIFGFLKQLWYAGGDFYHSRYMSKQLVSQTLRVWGRSWWWCSV